MNWLLKIVEGPVKGAEIALVEGIRLKVGSADTCDIVIADNTIAGEAFELDVAPEAVSFIDPSGAVSELVPFEIKSIGTTSFAIGPAEGNWKALVKKPVEAPKPSEVPEDKEIPADKDEEAPIAEATAEEPKKKRRGVGCLIALLIAVLLGAAIWALFHYRPAGAEKYLAQAESYESEYVKPYLEKAKPYAERGEEVAQEYWAKVSNIVKGWFEKEPIVVEPVTPPEEALKALADEHGLVLSEAEGGFLLIGNCALRTERRAIRALALAIDSTVKFDLTDDETLRESSNELLFALTGGTLKAVKAENRVVTIVGYAETSDELASDLVALNADVKGIENVDTTQVRLGLKAPTPVIVPSPAENIVDKAAPDVVVEQPKKVAKTRAYPVAGILMKPYPCVVMRNGLRLVEGSELGSAHIEKIEAGKIVLKEGGATFVWEP